jgi:hypothetical protein
MESLSETGLWEHVIHRINQGKVIPILSNSFRMEQIFREEKREESPSTTEPASADADDLTIEEQLTKVWAEDIGYPLSDIYNLARVAQYFLVEQKDNLRAREKYLQFLKTILLDIAEGEEGAGDLVRSFRHQIEVKRFSDIVEELEYPRFPEGTKDPLRLLAELPLPLYMTTSPYDFLERELTVLGKTPVTQVCFWGGSKASARREHLPNPELKPDADNPIVYHLYGLEDYPQTMVLSEDDYMNFLVAMAQDNDTQNPILPLDLRGKLAEQTLLLLGYQLRDWDFRVLFRFIAKYRTVEPPPPRGILIQLKKNRRQIGNLEKSLQYLSNYFDKKQFDVEWSEAESFVRQLAEKWNETR